MLNLAVLRISGLEPELPFLWKLRFPFYRVLELFLKPVQT